MQESLTKTMRGKKESYRTGGNLRELKTSLCRSAWEQEEEKLECVTEVANIPLVNNFDPF
jgi:hypothetical protein